jgi:hypothetical protein
MFRSIDHHQGAHVEFLYLPALGTTCTDTRYAATPLVELTKCFTDYFNILT